MTALPAEPPAPVLYPTTFEDRLGRPWRVRITAGLLGRLRREADVDLGRLTRSDGNLARGLGRLVGSPDQFGRFMWVLVGDQSEARGVTPEQFVDGFDGPTLGRCTSAVVAALAEFSPRSAVAAAAYHALSAADRAAAAGG